MTSKTKRIGHSTKLPKKASTAIERCVQAELQRYLELLEGDEPSNLYRMVVRQAEHAVIEMAMQQCGGNQSRASEWLGISRGNLRSKLSDMDY